MVHTGKPFRGKPRTVVHDLNWKLAGWHLGRKGHLLDATDNCKVVWVRLLLEYLPTQFVVDQDRLEANPFPRLLGAWIHAGIEYPFQAILIQSGTTMRTWETLLDPFGIGV